MSAWDAAALAAGTDKASAVHGYAEAYERLLRDLSVRRMVEIGVAEGASLRMWETIYPEAIIIGVDKNPACAQYRGRAVVAIGDIAVESASAPRPEPGQPLLDLVVDDGSHETRDVRAALDAFVPWLDPFGVHIIEDVALPDRGQTTIPMATAEELLIDHGLSVIAAVPSLLGQCAALVARRPDAR